MKNILLISNKVFHYRVPIYNYFHGAFRKEGYNLCVLTNKLQENFDHQPVFECIVKKPGIKAYQKVVEEYNPSAVIFFMHLKDWIMWPTAHWLKLKKVPFIYWNHGINLQDPENTWKNIFYHYLHDLANAIVLYSPEEKKYIKKRNQEKVFIGYNTLNFNEFPVIRESKEELKAELDIPYKKVIIFAARNNPARKLDLLLEAYQQFNEPDIGVIIAGGGGLNEKQQEIVDKNEGIMHLGQIPSQLTFNKLVKLSDVFTIPGKSGLAINQAFYWSVPYVTTNVKQSPEIWYLKDGHNGFIANINEEEDYRDKLFKLLQDNQLRSQMSENANKTAREEASIDKMFSGFYNAVTYVHSQKKVEQR